MFASAREPFGRSHVGTGDARKLEKAEIPIVAARIDVLDVVVSASLAWSRNEGRSVFRLGFQR